MLTTPTLTTILALLMQVSFSTGGSSGITIGARAAELQELTQAQCDAMGSPITLELVDGMCAPALLMSGPGEDLQ